MRLKWILILMVGLALGTGCGKQEQPATTREASQALPSAPSLPSGRIASLHFVGGRGVRGETNLTLLSNTTILNQIWDLPETQALKEQTLAKLARAACGLLHRNAPTGTNDLSPLIRPLLDDLLSEESWAEIRGETNQTPDFVLAVHLDVARAQLWQTNLSVVLAAWADLPATEIKADGINGWEFKGQQAPNRFRFVRAGDWVIVGAGQDKIVLADELVAHIKAEGRPCSVAQDHWLSVEWDWSRLSQWTHLLDGIEFQKISHVRAIVGGKGANVRTRIVVTRDGAFDWKPQVWHIPTNIVRNPLISFTAVQGIGPWLSERKSMQRFKTDSMPDQFYLWALDQSPLQTFSAVLSANATNDLEQLAARLLLLNTNTPGRMAGHIDWRTNHSAVVWLGLPFIIPSIEPVHEANGEFLFAGMFPNSPYRTALPEGLLAQFTGRTNLVYYDWEITSKRLPGCLNVSQLFLMLGNRKQLDGNSAAGKWLSAITPKLGNSATEGILSNPDELTLMRLSPIGLTSIELIALAHWLETTNFPAGGFHLPPHLGKPVRRTAPPAHP